MLERSAPLTLIQAVLWRRLDEPAFEHSRLMASAAGYVLEGRVLTLVDQTPTEAHYSVHCGPDWITRNADLRVVQRLSTKRIRVHRDDSGRWRIDDQPRPELDGMLDVDLALTPSTNTLPIHRLALRIGESQPTDAAWVRFPDLACERLPQRYTRLGERHYRYESNSGSFAADIHVDDHGVVIRYGDLWDRVTAAG
jgi:hypothetical protein